MHDLLTSGGVSTLSFLFEGWLWSLTGGWYQNSLGLLFTWVMFVYISRMKSLPALILSVTSYWSAFVVYTLIMALASWYIMHQSYIPAPIDYGIKITVGLGILFTILQSIFFHLVKQWYRVRYIQVVMLTLVGNGIAALFATYFLRLTAPLVS